MYGRFQGLHKGYLKALNYVSDNNGLIIVSPNEKGSKNPLSWTERREALIEAGYSNVGSLRIKNLFDVIANIAEIWDGDIEIVCGEDRLKDVESIKRYFPQLSGVVVKRDYSATKLRNAAINGDIEEFKNWTLAPSQYDKLRTKLLQN